MRRNCSHTEGPHHDCEYVDAINRIVSDVAGHGMMGRGMMGRELNAEINRRCESAGLRRLVGNDCTQLGHHFVLRAGQSVPTCWGCGIQGVLSDGDGIYRP